MLDPDASSETSHMDGGGCDTVPMMGGMDGIRGNDGGSASPHGIVQVRKGGVENRMKNSFPRIGCIIWPE